MMQHSKVKIVAAGGFLLCASLGLMAQESTHPCEKGHSWSDKPHVCEVREVTIAAQPSLKIDSGQNGGIAVQGQDRQDITVRAEILAWGNSEAEARELEQKLHLATDGGHIRIEGGSDSHYSASFSIKTPHATGVDAHAENGGISLADLEGNLRFETSNGGLNLANLAGDAKGETTNGGIHVKLDGARWNGSGLNVRSTNGGVHAEMPSNYAAHLEVSTVNGGLRVDVPFSARGAMKNSISADVGGGGPTVHLETVNGGVSVTASGQSTN